jgi:hypothetical protein
MLMHLFSMMITGRWGYRALDVISNNPVLILDQRRLHPCCEEFSSGSTHFLNKQTSDVLLRSVFDADEGTEAKVKSLYGLYGTLQLGMNS